jgi:hypothetical protein
MAKKPHRKTVRPAPVRCRDLILMDTTKIKKHLLTAYRRKKKSFEKLESQLRQYNEQDIAEYQKYLAQRFGQEMSRQRELQEKIHLTESRIQLIFHMADEKGMSRARYCYHLKSKVTDEVDFWSVLDQEYQEFIEEIRREEEAWQLGDNDDFEDDEDLDDDDDFGDFEEILDDIFDDDPLKDIFHGLNDLFGSKPPSNKNEGGELKRLYRELCLRYHPDRAGEHDSRRKHLWISIQEAYQEKDVERLKTIHTGIELELNPESAAISCACLADIINDLEFSAMSLKSELRRLRKSPAWGFTAQKSSKRQELEQEIRQSFQNELCRMEQYLERSERDLQHLMDQYKPKAFRRKTRNEQFPLSDKVQDLFNF